MSDEKKDENPPKPSEGEGQTSKDEAVSSNEELTTPELKIALGQVQEIQDAIKGVDISASMEELRRASDELRALNEAVWPADELRAALKSVSSSSALEGLRRAMEEIDAIKNAPTDQLRDTLKSIENNAALDGLRRASEQIDALKMGLGPSNDLYERMRALTAQVDSDSNIVKIAKQLQDQHGAIDALRSTTPPATPVLSSVNRATMLPNSNPFSETNERLGRIEERFEQMLDVAATGAAIATGLQAHAAEFLVKFENAASDNSQSTSRAIKLGKIAIVIALAMPLAQIIYTEFWRVPRDTASIELVISGMKTELNSLGTTQIETTDRLISASERSDQQIIEVLREIVDNLVIQPTTQVEEQ